MSNKPINPFEHHHPHYHDEPPLELDPAQQSLSDALKVSFSVLKLAMFVLVIIYMGSGFFKVPDQQVAVKLRFGKIVGDTPKQQVIMPGGLHVAFPQPIDKPIFIPIDSKRLQITRAFWFEQHEHQKESEHRGGPLNPEKDGSLLTGDANIVHAKWQVTYTIGRDGKDVDQQAVIHYVNNVGDTDTAERLVQLAVEQGIIHAIAQTTADELIKGQLEKFYFVARARAQKTLDQIESGIVVDQIVAIDKKMPVAVADAYQRVTQAESQRAQLLEKARQTATQTLAAVAGEANEPLWQMIQQYELAVEAGDDDAIAAIEKQFDHVFQTKWVETEAGRKVAISGMVARMINEAYSYKTQIVRQTEADAERFTTLLEAYKKSPRIVTSRLWQDARQAILSGDVKETFYVPGGDDAQVYIELNPDPAIKRQKELQQLQATSPQQ